MSIGTAIRELRLEAGLTQEEVAAEIGVSRSAIAQWENGLFQPRMGNIRKLAALFGTTVSSLIDDEPTYPPHTLRKLPRVTLHTLSKTHADLSRDESIPTDTIEVPASVLDAHPAAAAVIVEGDCMDRVAPDGVAVVYDPALSPTNGDIVVCETPDRETHIRRWYRFASTLVLVADSHRHFDDIVIAGDAPVRLIGTVVWMQSPVRH